PIEFVAYHPCPCCGEPERRVKPLAPARRETLSFDDPPTVLSGPVMARADVMRSAKNGKLVILNRIVLKLSRFRTRTRIGRYGCVARHLPPALRADDSAIF